MSTRSERKQNRIDRYNELARKAETKSIEAFEHSNSIVKCIPMGQPILVGHHSEKRHRRDLDKSWNAMGKSVQESEKAEYYRKKAEAAENNNAIYTEDEDSVERLEEKIARLEKLQQAMKDRNKIVRDKKLTEEEKIAKLIETGMTEKAAQGLIVPDVCNDIGYAACYLTNNSATIRNAKKRLERVKRLKSQEEKTYEVNGIRVVENPQENRFQIFFVKKPAEENRQKLQHVGYRYSYGNGCWQCYLKRWNIEAGKQILMSLGND